MRHAKLIRSRCMHRFNTLTTDWPSHTTCKTDGVFSMLISAAQDCLGIDAQTIYDDQL
jgi:hypothetical protein